MTVVAVDIGGTHARFAIAELQRGAVALGDVVTLATRDFASFEAAWGEFARRVGGPLPDAAGIAVAAPLAGGTIRFTNNHWSIEPGALRDRLALRHCALVNDFEAVGHAVAACAPEHFGYLAGPAGSLADLASLSVVGPGTGLGVAQVLRDDSGAARVQASEGGHAGFAPTDALDDALVARLRRRYGRVSAERVVSGPAIAEIHAALLASEGRDPEPGDDRALWCQALAGTDPLAEAAALRLCANLGAVAGDIALIHGSEGVVIAGGLGLRLRALLPRSGFAARFRDKGRFEQHMAKLPVRLLIHPQPGLLGAAICARRALAHDR